MTGRRLSALIMLIAVACLGTGCWDKKEFNKISFAETIAIDYIDHQYVATIQLMVPKNLQEGGENAPLWIISGQGETVTEAVDDIVLRSPREIFWGHLNVVLLGEEVLKEDLSKTIDFFTRDSQLRRRNYFLATQGEARKILEAKPELAQINNVYIYNLIEDQERRVSNSTTTLNDVLLGISSKGLDLLLPKITLLEQKETIEGEEGEDGGGEDPASGGSAGGEEKSSGGKDAGSSKKVLELSGGALVRDGKLTNWTDRDWANGFYWVTGRIHKGSLTIDHPFDENSKFSLHILSSNCKISLVQAEPLTLKLKISSQLNIAENSSASNNKSNNQQHSGNIIDSKWYFDEIEKHSNEKIRQQVLSSIAIAQENDCDVFGLGQWLRAYHPELKDKLDNEHYFSDLKIEVEVDCKIKLAMIIN